MAENIITNLTPDVEIKGSIKFDKVMRVDGKFEGEMVTNDGELIVGMKGIVKANAKVKNVSIEGTLEGNIVAAEKVELKHKAQLLGDLQARTLVIEEGVIFNGQCNVNPDGKKFEKQKMEGANKVENGVVSFSPRNKK